MVERLNRSAMTTCPFARAGRITRSTRSARAARNKNSSAPNARSWRDFSASLRAASAIGVPPGSRTVSTSRPSARSVLPSQRTSVDLPAPSGPSTTTKTPPFPVSPEGNDGARGALFDALVDPGIDFGHQLLEVRLRRDHLLIHRVALHALQGLVVLLDLLFGRFFALLRDAFDVLREPLRFSEHFLHRLVLAQRLRRAPQRFVFVGLAEHAPQVLCPLFEH